MAFHNHNIHIRSETTADIPAIHAVHTQAFERTDEADLVDALRNDGFVVLSLVAIDQERIVGHIPAHSITAPY